jgi:hypothetical protein
VFPELGIPSDEKIVEHALPKIETGLQVVEGELKTGEIIYWVRSLRSPISTSFQAPMLSD